jgi:SpoVK/Ycf46/Vps4 family AAA+-type ATPase
LQQTQLAKAVAGEAHAAFLSIGPSDILSKYVGESEEAVRSVFAEAVQLAGNNRGGNRCAVLFFDEIDALGRSRGEGSNNNGATGREGRSELSDASGASDNSSRRILAELLIQLTKVNSSHGTYDSLLSTHGEDDAEDEDKDGEDPTLESRADEIEESHIISSDDTVISQEETKFLGNAREQHNEIEDNSVDNSNHSVRVIVIAATNRPEDCDPALIRRFAVQVQVGLPTAKDRRKMLKRSMEDIEHTITKQQFSDLSLVTDGWSGSDIQGLAREAAMAPVRECIRRAAQMKRRRLNPNPHRRKKKIDSLIAEQAFPKEDMERERHNENNNTYQIAPERHARDNKQLLEEFRNLRPVKLQDYTKALAFWFNRMYDNLYDSPLAEFGWMEEGSGNHDTSGNCRLNEHYDSSSDEDDDEEFTNQPAE